MNPLDPSPKGPTGSLEELFRHHLLESAAAAVPPRPFVWEQLDNSLLLRQNEQYRRRLGAYRWAMAASLLLTLLVGGGWWHSQLNRPTLATGRLPATLPSDASASEQPASGTASAALSDTPSFSTSRYAIEQNSTLSSPFATSSAFASLGAASIARHGLGYATSYAGEYGYAAGEPAFAFRTGTTGASRSGAGQAMSLTAGRERAVHYDDNGAANRSVARNSEFAADDLAPINTPAADEAARADDALRTRLASLRLPATAALPAQLPGGPVTRLTQVPKSTSHWTLQVAYAGGMFDPNIDFTKSPDSYNANLGPGTVATTRDAAAEYRHNLRAGLSQRLSLWATRRLGIGRWSLRTGLEASQNEAGSASSVAFVGEQVSTLNTYVQVLPNRTQPTFFRYRAVSIPVEATYNRPLRRSLSLYGRAGALFSALLNVRSEVTSDPEADRSYSLRSVGSPYRHLSANLRGGVGLRYQPDGQPWAFSLGPVAETGIMSLNIDPSQTFWNQQRPYSVGLEAGLEFGSWLKPAAPVLP